VKTPGRRRVSPQKARPAITTHDVLPDDIDVFQSHCPKLPSPLLTGITQHADRTIDLSPEIIRSHSAIIEEEEDIEEDIAQQPLPLDPPAPAAFVDMSVPLREEASVAEISQNPSLSHFPSLAAPSPLRKSTRNPRESSLECSQATTTPGTGLTSHHTSWLAKVREAKAMEVTTKRASVAPASLITHSGGTKRKSGDVPGRLPHGREHEERKVKIPKIGEDVTETTHFEPRPVATSTFLSQVVDVHIARSADGAPSLQPDSDVDLMAPMRKAIESLRARTGKSIAGNLMETNAGVDEVAASKTDVPLRPNPLNPASTQDTLVAEETISNTTSPKLGQQVAESIVVASHEAAKRLSLSDHVPKHDRNFTSTNETSISTTPPNSPPVTKKTTFFIPGGPVFNKPPPVFVPPPATLPKSSSPAGVPKGNVSELPDHALGAPFGLGLHPMKLTKSPPLPLFSGQSTQSSSFSDNVFPAWVPDSQNTQVTSQESLPVLEKREHPTDLDDDDSWRLDDKFAETNQMWTPFAGITAVEDSMTWSTAPSQSQIGGKSPRRSPTEDAIALATRSQQSQDIVDELDEGMDVDVDDDIRSDTMGAGKLTVGLVTVWQ